MAEPIKMVIFDCDGVLVDTEPLAVRISVALGAEFGWPLTEDEAIERFVGRSEAAVAAQIGERLGAEVAVAWQRRFVELHTAAVDRELTAVPGIESALDSITVPTCVASSGRHAKMRHTLGTVGLYERFAGRIFSATEVAEGKPAPDLFLHAARRMGFAPAACAVVEDSKYGVQAARAAGMRSFGYVGGVTPADWLVGQDTVLFEDMRALPELLRVAGA